MTMTAAFGVRKGAGQMAEPMRVGVAGLGTVGAATVRMVQSRADVLAARSGRPVAVVAVSSRDRAKDRGFDASGMIWFDDPVTLARSPEIDVFVELIGGAEGPARAAVTAALESGKAVVTANKALLAAHGMELARLAEQQGGALAFEAAVAGGIPVIKTLREALAGNAVRRVAGILNGTCNYILSKMEQETLPFDACLAEAQRLGYAEADPTFDIGGFDAAHKLAILASLAFGTAIDAEAIHVEGIETITLADLLAADDLGYRVKLLGVAERTHNGVEARVHPTMVAKSAPLAQVMGVTNAVSIDADPLGALTLVGPGAGGDATASSVVADIADLARESRCAPLGLPSPGLAQAERIPVQRHEGGYYIRLDVADRPGAMAAIATRMAERDISLESIVQKAAHGSAARVPVILITHATSEALVREALDRVVADGFVSGKPQLIRIERA
jgi:homoserine dehydrogenase